MSAAATGRKPVRGAGEPPLFLHELIADAPAGCRVLDAGCGPGSWRYGERPELRVTGFDIKFPPGPPSRAPHVSVLRADLARVPFRDGAFDLTLCHYVLEHVTGLAACCDELARITRSGGTLYLAVPRSASFDDRLYRFAGYVAKYVLLKLHKRIEHQQRFDLAKVKALFAARGLHIESLALVPAGFTWMNDARTKRLQGPFTELLAWLHRVTGLDLARDANLVMTLRKTAAGGGEPHARRVTHVCRDCGEHSIVAETPPLPMRWRCPWCGADNPFGRPR